jgi:hypothetical protein
MRKGRDGGLGAALGNRDGSPGVALGGRDGGHKRRSRDGSYGWPRHRPTAEKKLDLEVVTGLGEKIKP